MQQPLESWCEVDEEENERKGRCTRAYIHQPSESAIAIRAFSPPYLAICTSVGRRDFRGKARPR